MTHSVTPIRSSAERLAEMKRCERRERLDRLRVLKPCLAPTGRVREWMDSLECDLAEEMKYADKLAEELKQAKRVTIEHFNVPHNGAVFSVTEIQEDGTIHHATIHESAWREGSPRPKEPGAYWRPDVNKSEVWTLTPSGRWHHNLSGEWFRSNGVEVPDGLQLLGLIQED